MRYVKSTYDYDEIFKFIVRYKRLNDGLSPTYREIMDACKVSSASVVRYILDRLVEDGKIQLIKGKNSGIKVIGGRWSMRSEEGVAYNES